MSNIHPLSVVHPNAIIGDEVTIDPFVVVEDDVVIGDGTHLMSNSNIMSGARLGEKCKVFPGAVVGAVPQDLKFKGEYTTVEIGDEVTIRECVTINRGTAAFGKTIVGSNTLLMAYVHVAHDCIIGQNVVLVNNVNLGGHVEIDDFAIIGGMTAVHQFVRIGQHTMIGGGSLVRKDVPPFIKAAREPLSYAGVNSIGLKRRDFSDAVIEELQSIYKILFVDSSNIDLALKELVTDEMLSVEKQAIVDFINKSQRGLIKGYR